MESKIENSKILDMAWDYFKLLAQQRITHFNLFIVFMGVLTTVLLSNINSGLKGNVIAIVLSIIQMFLCFIFRKIDVRNKYLTKHTERIIKLIEETYEDVKTRIFIEEEITTLELRQDQKKIIFPKRQLSLSQLYRLFYMFFLCIGFIEIIVSFTLIFVKIVGVVG